MRYVFQKPRPAYDKLTVAPPAARYVGMHLVWARFEAGGISFLRQSTHRCLPGPRAGIHTPLPQSSTEALNQSLTPGVWVPGLRSAPPGKTPGETNWLTTIGGEIGWQRNKPAFPHAYNKHQLGTASTSVHTHENRQPRTTPTTFSSRNHPPSSSRTSNAQIRDPEPHPSTHLKTHTKMLACGHKTPGRRPAGHS
ncbi:hypothetical protein SAMN04488518_101161 [Pseudovibrio ascidiaceicola]|uniref:Uncharacterized protein n=1 Tax=Pseudovibrio ascidiaceicola TaxID=285279 RepID=A0A1I3V4Z6_9HYPH|nr:hypothetical protein SAMN04488518_101161 [Pseudovibrio ascidiaceicola]